VLGSDYERLGELAESHTSLIGSERFMAMHEGRCVALEIGSDGGFSCRIYALRPAVCRELEPGSAGCAEEIALKAERARAACRRSISA
jgi:Fe-S-cluster containining protein